MAKNLQISVLLDFYGEMLTEKQREVVELYYNEDLSLAEIAENYGITRQGVRDVIVRAEAILTELEDKTGIIKRFHKMQDQFQELQSCLDGIKDRNEESFQDNGLYALCQQMQEVLDMLKQE